MERPSFFRRLFSTATDWLILALLFLPGLCLLLIGAVAWSMRTAKGLMRRKI